MSTWIALTEAKLTPLLTAAQTETLSARPHKDGLKDPLNEMINGITGNVRDAIRAVEENILSADTSLLPPEFIDDAAYLVIELLEGRIPGFIASEVQLDRASAAATTIGRVRTGSLTVSRPDAPEATPDVRNSLGTELIRKRSNRITGKRLSGL